MTPAVTIGMPVRNGAQYVEEAIRSLLVQTEDDFILHISDNCSDDSTPEICARLAEEDSRIRYERQERNLGSAANFEYLLRVARTPFFMWAAHDDIRDRTFLETSLRLLHESADAVACSVGVRVIDVDGVEVKRVLPPPGLASSSHLDRARAVTKHHGHLAIYGLMRRDELGRISIGDHFGADQAFVFRMTMMGRIVTTDQILITYRLLDIATRGAGVETHLYDYSRTPTDMYRTMARDVEQASLPSGVKAGLRLHITGRWLASARQAAINRNIREIHRARVDRRYGRMVVRVPILGMLAPNTVIGRLWQHIVPGKNW